MTHIMFICVFFQMVMSFNCHLKYIFIYNVYPNNHTHFFAGVVNKKVLKNNQSLGHLIWKGWALLGWHLAHLSVQKLFASVICNEHFWVLGGLSFSHYERSSLPRLTIFAAGGPKAYLLGTADFIVFNVHFFVGNPEQRIQTLTCFGKA